VKRFHTMLPASRVRRELKKPTLLYNWPLVDILPIPFVSAQRLSERTVEGERLVLKLAGAMT
jgi:hypothetical protein